MRSGSAHPFSIAASAHAITSSVSRSPQLRQMPIVKSSP